jgi:hypothetical protein
MTASRKITPTESNRLMAAITTPPEDWDLDSTDETEGLDLLLAIARQHGHKGAAKKFEDTFRHLFVRAVNPSRPIPTRVFPAGGQQIVDEALRAAGLR